MAKVFYQVQTAETFVLEVVRTPTAKLYRNRTQPVATITGLDQADPSKITLTFVTPTERATWLGYIKELKRDGKEGEVSEVAVAVNLSKQLLADGREKPYLKQEGFYGEYTKKTTSKTPSPKGPAKVSTGTHGNFLLALAAAVKADPQFGESMITADESMEIVFGDIIYYIKPRVQGHVKVKGGKKVIEEVEAPAEA